MTVRRFCHHCGERLPGHVGFGTCQCDDVSDKPRRFDEVTGARLDPPAQAHVSLLGNVWRTGPIALHDLARADGRAPSRGAS